MASPVEVVREFATEPALDPRGEGAAERPPLREVHDVCRGDFLAELDRRLVALCHEGAPLRAVLARIAARLVSLSAWERIGYARLSDYAVERLGLSARSVQSLAQVGLRLREQPRLEDALVSGTLGWTKVRHLARLPPGEDQAAWITYARRVTAEKLSKQVRAVDRGSVEAGAAEDEGAKSRLFEVQCDPEVRSKWQMARGAASKASQCSRDLLGVRDQVPPVNRNIDAGQPVVDFDIGQAGRQPRSGGFFCVANVRMIAGAPAGKIGCAGFKGRTVNILPGEVEECQPGGALLDDHGPVDRPAGEQQKRQDRAQ